MSVTPQNLQHDVIAGLKKQSSTYNVDVNRCIRVHLLRNTYKLHDRIFGQNKACAEHNARHQIHHKGKRIDHVHPLMLPGTQILRHHNGCCRCNDIEHQNH